MLTSSLSPAFPEFLKNYLLNAKLSNDNSIESTQLPFFNFDSEKSTLRFIYSTKREIPIIHEKLNRNIKEIYKYTQTDNQEIYINNWTFMSINEIKKRYNSIKTKRSNVIDIAFKYEGMGWILLLSCDLDNYLLFERLDGGSNGYDRESNLNKLIKDGSKFYKKFNFSQWIKKSFSD